MRKVNNCEESKNHFYLIAFIALKCKRKYKILKPKGNNNDPKQRKEGWKQKKFTLLRGNNFIYGETFENIQVVEIMRILFHFLFYRFCVMSKLSFWNEKKNVFNVNRFIVGNVADAYCLRDIIVLLFISITYDKI